MQALRRRAPCLLRALLPPCSDAAQLAASALPAALRGGFASGPLQSADAWRAVGSALRHATTLGDAAHAAAAFTAPASRRGVLAHATAEDGVLLLPLARSASGFRGVRARKGRGFAHDGGGEGFATALEAAVARARQRKRDGIVDAPAAPATRRTTWPREEREQLDEFWRERGLPEQARRTMLKHAESSGLLRDRTLLEARLEGLRALFPDVEPVALVARSLNVLRRDFDALAALLREMEAAVPQIDWRDAFARRPMLVCHAKATLKRNWDTLCEVLGPDTARAAVRRCPQLVSRPPTKLRAAVERLAQLLPRLSVAALVQAQPTMLFLDLGLSSLIPVKLARLDEAASASSAWAAEMRAWNESEWARALCCGPEVLDRLRFLAQPSHAAPPRPALATLKEPKAAFCAREPDFAAWAQRRADDAQRRLLGPRPARQLQPYQWSMGALPRSAQTDWLEDFGRGGRLEAKRRGAANGRTL